MTTPTELRRWLTWLHQPDRLAVPELIDLLRRTGRCPATDSPIAVGKAAAVMLTEAIERLKPSTGGREQHLPYLVLRTCFLEGSKRHQAANHLGISERQLSRERTRALELLGLELQSAPAPSASSPVPASSRGYRPERIPRIARWMPRARLARRLGELIVSERLVHVHGPRGVGKTSLVAEVVDHATAAGSVLWHRLRAGVSDSLPAVLFELGHHLSTYGRTDLATAIAGYASRDPALASRLALKDLAELPVLLVVDDYHVVADADSQLADFLHEAVERLDRFAVVTISRHQGSTRSVGASFAIPPLTAQETAALLAQLDIETDPGLADTLHQWTTGLPQLVQLAASWLKTADVEDIAHVTSALSELDAVHDFLLGNVADILDSQDRHILEAASIFRDRFTDSALAYVAERSRGQVADSSRRLIQHYLAARSRDGQVAFFHANVRDFVYERLPLELRASLHTRAAEWYERADRADEAAYHRAAANRPDFAAPTPR